MTITIQAEGRRYYLTGDTYPIKDALRAAGCKWDTDRKAWWTGNRETAEALAAQLASGQIAPKASFAKLADGTWGVRVPGTTAPGAKFEVTSKFGTKKVTIAAIVETRDGSSICSIVAEPRKSNGGSGRRSNSRPRGRWTGCSCGSIEDYPRDSDCASCRHDY